MCTYFFSRFIRLETSNKFRPLSSGLNSYLLIYPVARNQKQALWMSDINFPHRNEPFRQAKWMTSYRVDNFNGWLMSVETGLSFLTVYSCELDINGQFSSSHFHPSVKVIRNETLKYHFIAFSECSYRNNRNFAHILYVNSATSSLVLPFEIVNPTYIITQ